MKYPGINWQMIKNIKFLNSFDLTLTFGYHATSLHGCFIEYLTIVLQYSFHVVGFIVPDVQW